MTYSEVREMYSMDALEYIEKREKARKRVYSSISLFFSWLLPWTLSVALLILGINMLNAKSIMFSMLFLSLSLVLFTSLTKTPNKLKSLILQICRALRWLYSTEPRPLYHRDLKVRSFSDFSQIDSKCVPY